MSAHVTERQNIMAGPVSAFDSAKSKKEEADVVFVNG